MAIKTMTSTSTGQNKWEEGWRTVSISESIDNHCFTLFLNSIHYHSKRLY